MEKFGTIVLCVFFLCMFGGLAFEQHQKNECRIEAVKAGKSAEDIASICK